MHRISLPTRVVAGVFAAAALIALLAVSATSAPSSHTGFGFNARDIAGFPTGAVTLTGGGAFDPTTGFVHSGGGFSCTAQVSQGPLAGCLGGQGVRWDTAGLLSGTMFKCTGATSEVLK